MHALARFGQQGRGFAHEVHAAEHDMFGIDAFDAAGQFQGVPGHITMPHHIIMLVMMPHDAQAVAQSLLDGRNGVGESRHGFLWVGG